MGIVFYSKISNSGYVISTCLRQSKKISIAGIGLWELTTQDALAGSSHLHILHLQTDPGVALQKQPVNCRQKVGSQAIEAGDP